MSDLINPAYIPKKYLHNITLVNSHVNILCILCNKSYPLGFYIKGDLCLKLKVSFRIPWNPKWFKSICQLDSTFLFSSIIITEVLSAGLKSELHLLPVSELGEFHILVLNFGAWPFDIIAPRHLRRKSGHSNERVNRKPINRILKTLLNEGFGSFLRATTSELWRIFRTSSAVFWIKKKT